MSDARPRVFESLSTEKLPVAEAAGVIGCCLPRLAGPDAGAGTGGEATVDFRATDLRAAARRVQGDGLIYLNVCGHLAPRAVTAGTVSEVLAAMADDGPELSMHLWIEYAPGDREPRRTLAECICTDYAPVWRAYPHGRRRVTQKFYVEPAVRAEAAASLRAAAKGSDLPVEIADDPSGVAFVTTTDGPLGPAGTRLGGGSTGGFWYELPTDTPEQLTARIFRVLEARGCQRIHFCHWMAFIGDIIERIPRTQAWAQLDQLLSLDLPASRYDLSAQIEVADPLAAVGLLETAGERGKLAYVVGHLDLNSERRIHVHLDGNAQGFRLSFWADCGIAFEEIAELFPLPVPLKPGRYLGRGNVLDNPSDWQ